MTHVPAAVPAALPAAVPAAVPAPAPRRVFADRAERGFSFVEILVVMGIIAVLVGIGIGVYSMVIRKTPLIQAGAQVDKLRTGIEAWRRQFKMYPPSDLNKLRVIGIPITVSGRLNAVNTGIESLYQCLHLPAVDFNPDIQSHELSNLDDEDRLDKAITKDGNPQLYEIKDPWGNPYVYFVDGDYETAEKAPPTYQINDEAEEETPHPKPWRTPQGGFAQPGAYQLYSMGPDGKPNTDDDVKAWQH